MGKVGIWINGEAISRIRLEIKMQKLFARLIEVMTPEDASASITMTVENLAILPYDHLREQVVDRLRDNLEEMVKKGEKNEH